MAKIIKNFGEFADVLAPKIKKILELVAEDVKNEINTALSDYYEEYNPNPNSEGRQAYKKYWYYRTYQLRDCCEIRPLRISGNTISTEVYLDIESLNYKTPGADPFKTVVAANSGLHGGWDVDIMEQIPWAHISENNGTAYGDGTQIWEEPVKELLDNNKLIYLFKKYAKLHGLNIR